MIKHYCDGCSNECSENTHRLFLQSKWQMPAPAQPDGIDELPLIKKFMGGGQPKFYGKEFRLCDSCFVKFYQFLTKSLPKNKTVIKRT